MDDVVLVVSHQTFGLVARSLLRTERAHLNTWSDHDAQVATGVKDWRDKLGQDGPPLDFGMRFDRRLGRITLMSYGSQLGLTYWVAESACRRGLATAAVAAAVQYARVGRGGTDFLAGVTHGNVPSVTVLERNGFVKVAEFPEYCRYHRALSFEGLTAERAATI